ncbi:MAG: ABC transporter substrate-binding protein [Nitrospirota bacterium]
MQQRMATRSAALVAFVLLCFGYVPAAGAGEATEQVRQTVEQIRSVFKDRDLNKPEKKKQRNARLRTIVEGRFDFEEMSKRSLGLHWSKRTPEEQREFVSLYKDLLEDVYLRKLEQHESKIKEHVEDKVVYLDERTEGSYALVRTAVVTKGGKEVRLDYRLLRKNEKWEVYDVYIEGVSLVNNYRKQFSQIIRSGSYEDLLKRLRAKSFKEPEEKP